MAVIDLDSLKFLEYYSW